MRSRFSRSIIIMMRKIMITTTTTTNCKNEHHHFFFFFFVEFLRSLSGYLCSFRGRRFKGDLFLACVFCVCACPPLLEMETAANIQWLERDLSPRRARILNLETISALRKQKEELLKEIAVQKELEEKIEKKWKEGEMGKKWKQLKRMDPTPKVKAEQQKLMEIRCEIQIAEP
jgi:hypothetical protein